MPGLSSDPHKRARQLAGLEVGRRTLALRTLGMDPDAAPPAPASSEPPSAAPAPTEPAQPARQHRGDAAVGAGAALGVPVHRYGTPPARPAPPEQDPAPVPVAEDPDAPDFTSERPRRGTLGRFFDGLRDA